MSVENIIQKLKRKQAIAMKIQQRLTQTGTVEEAFWDGYDDGLAVAILIVNGEQQNANNNDTKEL